MRVHAFRTLIVPARHFAGFCLGWLAALALASCLAQPSPVPSPPPSLTRSGTFDILAMHANGHYELQLTGTRVAAVFATSGSPVEHWARAVLLPLFTVPEPFRPPYPVLRTVEGRPVHADGTPDASRPSPHRFLLRVDPDGGVHYVDDDRVEGAGHLAYALHTDWDTAPSSASTPSGTPTPTPSLTMSGDYGNPAMHADGRYELQLAGTRVAAVFATSGSPVEHWARAVLLPLFTVPEPFRPPYPVLRTVEGRPVHADGTPDASRPSPHRFLLRVDPDGGVHYMDDDRVEGAGHLAYALHTDWDTAPSSASTPSGTPTPTPSLTMSGDYGNPAMHADGRYELQLAGTRVAASFSTSRSPVEYWVPRIVPWPLFTIPKPFRPPLPVLLAAQGTPVLADGAPDPDHPEPRRFLLRVDPDGGVHYVEDRHLQGAGHLAYELHTVWDIRPPPPPTFVPAVPSPTPSVTVSGTYANRVEHADGGYALQLSGTRVAATFSTTRSPVQYWAREVAAPLFTVPDGFRPPYPILRTVEGRPVLADGTPNPDHPAPRRFLLRVDPDGDVHYVDDARVEGEDRQAYCLNLVGLTGVGIGTGSLRPPAGIAAGTLRAPAGAAQPPPPSRCAAGPEHTGRFLAYSLDTVWGTTPAANDRAVLEVLDRYWFRRTLLSAEPPPVQFEVPEHSVHRQGTFPAERVGAFVAFDADGRVTALGAPTNEAKAPAGAPVYEFHGPLLPELGQLHHLEHLDLSYWGQKTRPLSGALPPQLGQLVRLRHLDLQGQRLTGSLPSDMGRLASLEYLDLSNNWLSGPLPPELGQLTSLQRLDLSHNRLSSDALPPEIGDLASLELLDLSFNRLTDLPPELGRLTSLQRLDLCNNQLSSDALPPEIGDLASLEFLDLSGNQLTDLPPELGRLSHLKWLHVSSSQLTALPPQLGQLGSLRALNLGSNQLTAIPLELGQLAHLEHLYLARNRLTALPPEWGQFARLRRLDLSYNQLTGPLPPEWGQLTHLEELHLDHNQLTGSLPPEWGQLTHLEELHLDHNQLTGPLPPAWGQLASLQQLDLYDNQLTGSLPPEWGQLTSLEYLYLEDHQLTGPLPPEWGQLDNLQTLDLSGNQLTGPLPSEWGQLANLQILHLGSNQLTGPLPSEWGQLARLERLYLYDNRLTGPLPPEWGQLARLQELSLRENRLAGPLPPEWGQLARLEWLDLRDNQLTGCFLGRASEGHYVEHDLPSCSPAAGQE